MKYNKINFFKKLKEKSIVKVCLTDFGGFGSILGLGGLGPAASLYCSPTGTVATVTVTAVRGGAVFSKAQNALNVPCRTFSRLICPPYPLGCAAHLAHFSQVSFLMKFDQKRCNF